MFADSFCETHRSSRIQRARASLLSFTAQGIAIGILLLVPLFYSQGIPQIFSFSPLVVPAAPVMQPVATTSHTSNRPGFGTVLNVVRNYKPIGIQNDPEPLAPPALDFHDPDGANSVAVGIPNSTGTALVTLASPPAATKPLRISRMMEGNLLRRVQPVYPAIARLARVQGTVELRAVISREGMIENLQAISGPAMLINAAIDAVRQWRYRPYYLNGDPIEVETTVTVNFTLSGG